MHTFNGKRCIIRHNNDLHEHDVYLEHADAQRAIRIPLSDLIEFIGGLVRDERIARLAQQTGREALLDGVSK